MRMQTFFVLTLKQIEEKILFYMYMWLTGEDDVV